MGQRIARATWIDQDETSTFDELAQSRGFASLDCKLNAAISDIVTGDLERRIGVLKEKAAKEGHLLKGRQVLHVIYEYYRVAEADGAVLEFEDLALLKMKGHNLEEFINAWETVPDDAPSV